MAYPLLIVADERRYRDSRDQDRNPNIAHYYDMLSDPFAAGGIEFPDGYGAFDQDNVSAATSLTAGAGLRQATTGAGRNSDPTTLALALTDIAYDEAGDNILVDVALARPTPPADLAAEVQEGQVTLRWEASTDPTVTYQYRYDGVSAPIRIGTDTTVPVDGLTNDTSYTFEVSAVNGLGTSLATLMATPQALGDSAVDFTEDVTPDEDDTPAVASYTATDLGDTPEWSLVDDARDAFELQGTGATRTLHFQQPPDYETPNATNPNPVYPVTIQARAGQVTATQAVTVTVTNEEEPGTVTVSSPSDPPRVGEELTAALQDDPDGVLTGTERWTWQRQAPGTTGWPNITDATDATYTLDPDDIGDLLQATVSYLDGESEDENDRKSAVSEPTAAVVGAPAAPEEFEATAADARVVLIWQAAPANGLPVQHYETRYSDDGVNWPDFTEVDGKDKARETTVSGLTNDTEYTFEVRAVNAAGAGEVSSTTATPHFIINESETTSVPFAEIPKGTQEWNPLVATYTTNAATDPPTPVTWSLDGTDKSAFVITDGALSFSAAPDFETQPTYAVTVQAQVRVGTPTASMASLDVTVEVENVEEAGSIGLPSTPPKVGTAVVAELTDPDGSITGACWIWQRAPDATSTTWEDRTACPDGVAASVRAESAEPYPELSSYTPEKDDIGYLLRATVTYNDGQGDGKDKQSDPTATAVAVPSVPRDLTTAPDDGQMLLSWRAPSSDGESAITG